MKRFRCCRFFATVHPLCCGELQNLIVFVVKMRHPLSLELGCRSVIYELGPCSDVGTRAQTAIVMILQTTTPDYLILKYTNRRLDVSRLGIDSRDPASDPGERHRPYPEDHRS
jgi:hypothetical protein